MAVEVKIQANKGFLVIFDGIDGSGKTTQLNLMAENLISMGKTVKTTRNLGGTPIGEELRRVLLLPIERPPTTDLHVSIAVQEALIPALNHEKAEGSLILLDRGPMSLVAYQSFGSGLDKDLCWQFADRGLEQLKPDLIIVYDADTHTALERARQHSASADYFESKPYDYFDRVASGFREASERYKDKYNVQLIDANRDFEQIHSQTMALITRLIGTS
jgi:dTMP kinase